MLAVIKPNKIQICLDPRDLNEVIKQEHYQMPTIEEVTTRLNRAKLFTVVDAKDSFWQKRLDPESSYKTTFNTPFGSYRWLRMPFGNSSVPEVWQRSMVFKVYKSFQMTSLLPASVILKKKPTRAWNKTNVPSLLGVGNGIWSSIVIK